jgi:hypothetical protein
MVRLFGPLGPRTHALQLLPFHFSVPADRLDRLFHTGPAQSSGSRDMAGAGLAGVLLGEQLAVRAAALGLDRVQLCDRPAVDLETAASRVALCGPHDRRRRRSPDARLFQVCRIPCRQLQCDLFHRLHRQRPASGWHFILHLHPDCVPGRCLQGQCRALRVAALCAVRHLFSASDRGTYLSPQGHDPAIRARGHETAGSASDAVRPGHLRHRPVQENLSRRRRPRWSHSRSVQMLRRSIRRGSARWPTPFSSISISPVIPTWRSESR